jgi:glutamate-ammonia-ligase adenylyltransferase
VDVEFLVQMLQIKYAGRHPAIVTPNILDALESLRDRKLLAADEAELLAVRYTFLRAVETRLRIVSNRSLSEIPHAPDDREKFARRLGFRNGAEFLEQYQRYTAEVRSLFDAVALRESSPI